MLKIIQVIFGIGVVLAFVASASGTEITSAYTKLDFEKHCTQINEETEEEAGGGTYLCKGYKGLLIYFKVGDLRESVQFGHLSKAMIEGSSESFGPWNRANNTFEWRLRDGKPFAVIHRVFIDNINPDTGLVDKKNLGQVLVVSSIARKDTGGIGCVVSLVDARANEKANEIARKIADTLQGVPNCSNNSVPYTGKKGPHRLS